MTCLRMLGVVAVYLSIQSLMFGEVVFPAPLGAGKLSEYREGARCRRVYRQLDLKR